MSDATTLRALAERVEGATHEGSALASALNALNLPSDQHYPLVTLLSVGAFLDAAASLVPSGWAYVCSNATFDGLMPAASVHRERASAGNIVTAATPALALCAAALRARAAMMEDGA